jgi:hypothetical protein
MNCRQWVVDATPLWTDALTLNGENWELPLLTPRNLNS